MYPALRMHSHASLAVIPLPTVPSSSTDVRKCKEACACAIETGVAESTRNRSAFEVPGKPGCPSPTT